MRRLDWAENFASGYPRNPVFNEKARQVLEESRADAEAAERFLRQMEQAMRALPSDGSS